MRCVQAIQYLQVRECTFLLPLQVAVYDAWAAYNSKVSAIYSKETTVARNVGVCSSPTVNPPLRLQPSHYKHGSDTCEVQTASSDMPGVVG